MAIQQLATVIAVCLVGVVGAVLGSVPFAIAVDPTLTVTTVLQSLEVASILLVPIVGAIVTVIVWLHRRLKTLEEARQKQQASLYGIKGDTLATGVTEEIRSLRSELQEFNATMEVKLDNLENRVQEIEEEVDEIDD